MEAPSAEVGRHRRIGGDRGRRRTPAGQLLADVAQYPVLSAAEERRLVRTMRTAPRRETAWACQRRLIQSNLQRVVSIAEEYRWSGPPCLDLIQEGNLGLMRAVDRYDPADASSFGSVAAWHARRRIQRAVGRFPAGAGG